MLLRGSRRRVFLDRLMTRIIDPFYSRRPKPLCILFRHPVDLVSLVAATEQSSESLERRCQDFNYLVPALLLRLVVAIAGLNTRILEDDRVGITFALDRGSTPHRSCRDGQN